MYESHITVNMLLPDFLEICKANALKAIYIDQDSGSTHKQLMTARFHRGEFHEAAAEMNDIANLFPSVIRKKLEIILGKADPPEFYEYMEFHAKFSVVNTTEFESDAKSLGLKVSRNTFHDSNRFVTSRDETLMKSALPILRSKYRFVNLIRECVILDTNQNIDNLWCNCSLKERLKIYE